MSKAISLKGVTKTFGDKVAVRDLDLEVPEGAVYGFIGPNGAGKTTTIRMIMSILFPDRGDIRCSGTPRRWRPRTASATCPKSAASTRR